MLVTGFPAGMFQTNCYVMAHDDARECVVIDPGQDATEPLLRFLAESDLRPIAVLLTHGHLDHTWSVEPVCRKFDIPAYIHDEDRYMLSDPLRGAGPTLSALLGDAQFSEPDEVRDLAGTTTLDLAGITFGVLHTPGHTQGSVVFTVEVQIPDEHTPDGASGGAASLALTGDTLFAGSIGRTDLPGGNHEQLLGSIALELLPLDDDTVILPGHGGQSSIGQERASNPFLVGLSSPEEGKL